MEFRIPNLDSILNTLDKLPTNVANAVVRKSLGEALQPLADEVKRQTPVRTGELQSQVSVTPTRNKSGFMYANVRMGGKDFVGSFLTYGWHSGGVLHPGNPFLHNAFLAKANEVMDKAKEILGEGVDEAIGK